ncbi:MAG: hypothetical protein K2Y21_04555 [Phycisphaerales bacterium]|nr:hypothetical protein [Phycisphaerales bacterium]
MSAIAKPKFVQPCPAVAPVVRASAFCCLLIATAILVACGRQDPSAGGTSAGRSGTPNQATAVEPLEGVWKLLASGKKDDFWAAMDQLQKLAPSEREAAVYSSPPGQEDTLDPRTDERLTVGATRFSISPEMLSLWRDELRAEASTRAPGRERELFIALDQLLRGILLSGERVQALGEVAMAAAARAAMLGEMANRFPDDPYQPARKRDELQKNTKKMMQEKRGSLRLDDVP